MDNTADIVHFQQTVVRRPVVLLADSVGGMTATTVAAQLTDQICGPILINLPLNL